VLHVDHHHCRALAKADALAKPLLVVKFSRFIIHYSPPGSPTGDKENAEASIRRSAGSSAYPHQRDKLFFRAIRGNFSIRFFGVFENVFRSVKARHII
jgi:hypothetical protein